MVYQKIKFVLFVIVTFGIISCGDVVDFSNPVSNQGPDGRKWISLPLLEVQTPDGIYFEKIFYTATRAINGKIGGELELKNSYTGGPLRNVKFESRLTFEPNSFDDIRLISMTIQPEYGSAVFEPHGGFNKPAIYNVKFEGLDLKGVDPRDVRFVYMAEDGTYEYISVDKIKIDVDKGLLQVINAYLPHFSRFGFVN
ncbi:MAG: hypothetical protein FJ213_07055 [Ignavibacteria bacterium]|nr:hypothetical protein [Ignavibacteria bacterium]